MTWVPGPRSPHWPTTAAITTTKMMMPMMLSTTPITPSTMPTVAGVFFSTPPFFDCDRAMALTMMPAMWPMNGTMKNDAIEMIMPTRPSVLPGTVAGCWP